MKSKIYLIIISLFLIFSFGLFLECFIRHDHPKFFEDEIEKYKNDRELMVSIGGFKKFTYEFNKNQLDEDTLDFKIIMEGRKSNFLVSGKAKKNEQFGWIIFKKEVIMNYEK